VPTLLQDHLSLQHFLCTNYAQTSDWKKKKKDSEKVPLLVFARFVSPCVHLTSVLCTLFGKWERGRRTHRVALLCFPQDPLVGGNFFLMVSSDIPCPGDAMKTIDIFGSFVREMKQATSECIQHSAQHSQRMAGAIRKEYQTIGSGYDALSKVCTKANTNDGDAIKLSMALTGAAAKMEACANLVKLQPAK
jgi:hypothetical protein